MTGREITPLPISLIPSFVEHPQFTTCRSPPPPPPSERDDVSDDFVLDTSCNGVEPVLQTQVETTVDLLDVDGSDVINTEPHTPSMAELLNNTLSLKQLKDRCIELGISNIGKKMELAERIASVNA
tara:strand:- start:27671 stop:28048 length:378 start_codon:yes stop_codon:yes gene_type:complete